MKKVLNNLYLIGMSGAGKTTVGKLLANRLHWAFIDVNQTIEAIYDRSLPEIIETFGEESFKKMEATIMEELSRGEHQVFACNCDSVLDKRKMKIMQSSGVTIWLDTPARDLIQRLKKVDPSLKKRTNAIELIEDMIADRKVYYQEADVRIQTDNVSPEDTTNQILQILKKLS